MDMLEFIQPLIAGVLGGGVVITTNWTNTQLEKRKTLQESYKQTYITEAIDPLITHLISLELRLRNKDSRAPIDLAETETFPVASLAKIQILVSSGLSVASIITFLNEYLDINDSVLIHEALRLLGFTCDALLDFREKCLKEFSTRPSYQQERVSERLAKELRSKLSQVQEDLAFMKSFKGQGKHYQE